MPKRPPPDVAPPRGASRGFTLLEVLVAFVIAALAIGVMIDGVVTGLRAASAASLTQQAVGLARSRLAAACAAVAAGIVQRDQVGKDGNFEWRVRLAPTESAFLQRVDAVSEGVSTRTPQATLYGITVTVSWQADGHTRQVRLDGARVGLVGTAPNS